MKDDLDNANSIKEQLEAELFRMEESAESLQKEAAELKIQVQRLQDRYCPALLRPPPFFFPC